MAVGMRRTQYGPPPFFGADDQTAPQQYMGFLDVAGQPQQADGVPQLPGVGGPMQLPEGQPETFEPLAPPEQQQQPQSLAGDDGGGDYPSQASIDRRMKMAEALLGQQQEVHHPMQAIANAVSQITGSYLQNKADKDRESLEKRRRDAWKGALASGGDINALADRLMASDDPDLVEKGLNLKLSAYKADNSGSDAPTTRNFYEGGGVVTKQWNGKTKQWEQVGDVAPRWKAAADDSGGDAGYDDEGNDPSLLDNDTIDFMADQYMAGDRSVLTNLGRGKSGVKNIVALRKRIAARAREIDPATGKPRMSPRQLASAQAELQGYGAYVRTTETQSAKMRGAAQEARTIGNDVVAASRLIPRSNLRAVNWAGNQFRAQTGDPNIVRLAAALNSYVNVYSRAINPTGQPTMADKEHARDVIATAMSHGQIEAAVNQLDREMQAAIASPREVRQQREEEFDSGDQSGPEAPPPMNRGPVVPPQEPLPPPAQRVVGKTERQASDGNTYVWGKDATGKVGWVRKR